MRKDFLVSTDISQAAKASRKVLAFLKPLDLSEAYRFDIRLCLEEALINAIKYGNQLKKDLKVLVSVEADKDRLRLRVEDQGGGFDVRSIKNCTHKQNLLKESGRGIYLIHHLMDEVQYNEKGNALVMTKRLR